MDLRQRAMVVPLEPGPPFLPTGVCRQAEFAFQEPQVGVGGLQVSRDLDLEPEQPQGRNGEKQHPPRAQETTESQASSDQSPASGWWLLNQTRVQTSVTLRDAIVSAHRTVAKYTRSCRAPNRDRG